MTVGQLAESISGSTVLVTGGAGFIGSHLVDRLVTEKASKVIVVDNLFLGSEENLREAMSTGQVELIRMNAGNLSAMQEIIGEKGVDFLFNLAVIPLPTSLKFPSWTVTTNVEIAITACELARRGLVGTLVNCSSSEVYGSAQTIPMSENHSLSPTTPYAASKLAGDMVLNSYVDTFGVRAITVRPFNNYGPRQNSGMYAGLIPALVQRVCAGLPVVVNGDGEQTRDYVYVKETVAQITRAATLETCVGETLHIASGEETSVNSIVRQLLAIMNKPSHPVIHTTERPGEVRRHLADTSKTQRLLSCTPSALSQEHLEETVDWYRERLCFV